jgi:hypothetical protein
VSHWAEIDETGLVIQVLVGDNNDPNGDEGYQWLIDNLGGVWIQTSYNATTNGFRKNYAGIGFTYDPINDWFFSPKPFESWTLDSNAKWQAPVPMPVEEGKFFTWNEATLSWDEVALPTK